MKSAEFGDTPVRRRRPGMFSSLRVLIPLLLLGFIAMSSIAALLVGVPIASREVDREAREDMRGRLVRWQQHIEYMIARGDMIEVRRKIVTFPLQDTTALLLADETGAVMASMERRHIGRQLEEVLRDLHPGVLPMEGLLDQDVYRTGTVVRHPEGPWIMGVEPVLLGSRAGQLRPDRQGILFMETDLSGRLAEERRAFEILVAITALPVVFLAFLLWLGLHFAITARMGNIIAAARRFAAGDLDARADISGTGDLARLGRAFDSMAARVGAAQNDLRNSETRYRQLIEMASEPVYTLSPEGVVTSLNPAFDAVTGWPHEEWIGRHFGELLHPEDLALAEIKFGELMSGATSPLFELRILARQGHHLHMEFATGPMYENGVVTGILGFVRDITERKIRETELRGHRDLLDALSRIQALYIQDARPSDLFEGILDSALSLTSSEYGFIGDVLTGPGGARYLKTRAITNIAWNDETRAFYDANVAQGLEFHNLKSLFGAVMVTGEAVIANDPANDPRRTGLPSGHPPMNAFLGLPLYHGTELIGMVGLANRANGRGYDEGVIEYLQPLLGTCSSIIMAFRGDEIRRRAEVTLSDNEARIRGIIDSALDAVISIDAEGRVTGWNARAERLFGWRLDEVLGTSLADTIVPPEFRDAHRRGIAHFLETGQGPVLDRVIELTALRRDGALFPIEISVSAFRDPEGTFGFSAFVQDLTERKHAETERQKLEAQIQHAQKLESLGVLAGGIAHDFNNLLVGILGNADLALMEMAPTAAGREYLADIVKTSQRAADLCKQMLAYSGKGKFVIQALNLGEIAADMAHLLEVSVSKKGKLLYRFVEGLPSIEGDATQVRQVIMNLITNASEALGDMNGQISIATGTMDCDAAYLASTYVADESDPGRYVFMEVSDTGCGMDEETLRRLFDPFFTTKFTGRGLGMAAVLGIVRGHRGAIKVYSEVGKGTTFKVLFPVSAAEPHPAPVPSAGLGMFAGSGTVLVVDDEEIVRTMSIRVLEHMGFTVIAAEDGQAGVDLFRQHSAEIRAVLMDMTMPRMGGEEAFREMRRIRADVRVILCSGYNEQDVISRFTGKGLAGFLQKPYQIAQLSDKLREILDGPAMPGT